MDANISRKTMEHNVLLPWNEVFIITCWFLWLGRNQAVFEINEEWTRKNTSLLQLFLREATTRKIPTVMQNRREVLLGWDPPPKYWIKVNIDGSARGSPGEFAAGGVCRDNNRQWVFDFHINLGISFAYNVEIYAIWQGLQQAWDRYFRRVILETDSELAIQRIQKSEDKDSCSGWDIPLLMCKQLLQRD